MFFSRSKANLDCFRNIFSQLRKLQATNYINGQIRLQEHLYTVQNIKLMFISTYRMLSILIEILSYFECTLNSVNAIVQQLCNPDQSRIMRITLLIQYHVILSTGLLWMSTSIWLLCKSAHKIISCYNSQ